MLLFSLKYSIKKENENKEREERRSSQEIEKQQGDRGEAAGRQRRSSRETGWPRTDSD